MNNNVGSKLKKVAIISFALSVILFVVLAIISFVANLITNGFIYLIAGIIVSLVEYYIIYAIGDTNDKVTAYQYQLIAIQEELKKVKAKLNNNDIKEVYSSTSKMKDAENPLQKSMKSNILKVIDDNFSSVSFKKAKLLQMYKNHNITEEEYDEAIKILEQSK